MQQWITTIFRVLSQLYRAKQWLDILALEALGPSHVVENKCFTVILDSLYGNQTVHFTVITFKLFNKHL